MLTDDFMIDAMAFTRQVAGLDPEATDYEETLRTLIGQARSITPETKPPPPCTHRCMQGNDCGGCGCKGCGYGKPTPLDKPKNGARP